MKEIALRLLASGFACMSAVIDGNAFAKDVPYCNVSTIALPINAHEDCVAKLLARQYTDFKQIDIDLDHSIQVQRAISPQLLESRIFALKIKNSLRGMLSSLDRYGRFFGDYGR